MDITFRHLWQAEKYHNNSGVQKEAAQHLLDQLNLKGNEAILDIGCGDGKTTLEIADRAERGLVYGTDLSEEMIDFAQKTFQPKKDNLIFLVQDAEKIEFSREFDLIFSSFALQWVPRVEAFFETSHQHLKPKGRLACTIPLGISDELEEALAFLLRQKEWSPYFQDFELNYFLRNAKIYEQLLTDYEFSPVHFEVIDQLWMFPSRKDFEMYTLMWLPHLAPLPDHIKEKFFSQLIDRYVKLTPLTSEGKVRFLFPRVDFIAHKGCPKSSWT